MIADDHLHDDILTRNIRVSGKGDAILSDVYLSSSTPGICVAR